MRILVCPTAFKGSLGAREAAAALAEGVRAARPAAQPVLLPVSDGGPGLLDALAAAASRAGSGTGPPLVERVEVSGPLGDPVEARLAWLGPGRAAVESADACGLGLLPASRRDPLRAETFGVGELLRAAADRGARRLWLGLGGSATVDGGTGAARAFGWRFLDAAGHSLPPGGGALADLERIVPGDRPRLAIGALADVRSPLAGPEGAARRFAPQKGAGPTEVERLERGLERLAERMRSQLGASGTSRPCGGAAGGLAAGLAVFLGARLLPGAEWVLRGTGFERELGRARIVVTGEGAWDGTSPLGKVTGEVLRRCVQAGVPALLVCGRAEGPAPPGALIRSRPGSRLTAADLSELAADGVRALSS